MKACLFARASARSAILFVALLLVSLSAHSAVGRTPGVFGVSPTGTAQYSIEIWTPPGAGGMRPQLSINYNHRRENGLLGMGFDVSGLSAITRCVKTISQDGARGGITLSSSDVFCLDGNRLRLDNGTYGASGSTYRTELETYSRITANGTAGSGPAWFKVEHRNGLIYEYGNSSSSRIEIAGSTAKEWALSSIRDRAGNTIEFVYTEDTTNGDYRPDEINYATNTTGGVTTAPYQVKFVYESSPRPDTIYEFWPAGGTKNELKRLQSIDIKYSGSTKKMYVFSYTSGAGSRSLLDEVKECSTSTSECLTPTEFSWTTSTSGYDPEQNPSQTAPTAVHLIDITGDGRDDLVYVNATTSGTWRVRKANTSGGFDSEINTSISNPNNTSAQPVRWDSDDKMDLMFPQSGTWRVLKANGTHFDAAVNTGISVGDDQPMDINGDGLDDLVTAENTGSGATLKVRYNTGAALGSQQTLWSTGDPNYTFHIAFPLAYQRYRSAQDRADFNGDGKEDFVCWMTYTNPEFGPTYTYVARCYEGGYETFQESDGSTFLGGSYMYGDVNDDGLSDIVWSGASTFQVLYGGSYGGGMSFGTGPSNSGFQTAFMAVADYDGDGRDDLIAQSTSSPFTVYWMRSTGTGLATAASTGFNLSSNTVLYIGHVNGDGFYDLLTQSGTTLKYRLHTTTYADLLLTAEDGFDVAATFTYAPMTDSTVYTKGTGATYPQQDVQSTRPIVKQVTATDGTGANTTYTLTYTYEKARRDHYGRGFLGFEKRSVVDSRTNLKAEETYSHTWPYTGLLVSAALKAPSTAYVLKLTENSWSALSYASGARQFPYIWKSETKDRELDNTHYRTTTTLLPGTNGASGINSTWGIVIDATTTTLEVGGTGDWATYSKTARVTNTLHVDSTNWCVRPETTEFENDLTISGIPSQTRTVERTWNSLCQVTQELIEPGDSSWAVDTDYAYDDFGNIETETVTGASMTARVTELDWGSSGVFPLEVENALDQITTYAYDLGLGVFTSVTDPNSEGGSTIITSWGHDNFGRKTSETRPDGTTTLWELAANNDDPPYTKYIVTERRRQVNTTEIHQSQLYFDRYDRNYWHLNQLPTGISGYHWATNRTEFDSLGRTKKRNNPWSWGGSTAGYWQYGYDVLNRLTSETLYTSGGSPNRSRTHTHAGLSLTTEDFKGNDVTRVSTAWGDLSRTIDPSGSTYYSFDAFGQLLKLTDTASAVVTEVTYNIRGMKETSSDTDMGQWTYLHNALGELVKVRDAKTTAPSWTTEFVVDALGRPTQRTESEGTTTWTWGTSAANNNIGALASVSGPGYSETFSYDAKARLSGRSIAISGDATYAIDYAYHAQTGFLDTLTYPVSTSSYRFALQYTYGYGALTRISRNDSPFTAYWTLDNTDARGNVIAESYANGVDIDSEYDPLTGFLEVRTSEAGALQELEYDWDLNGNLEVRRDMRQSLTETFSYDTLDRLTGSTLTGVGTNLTVAYDSIGNITSKDSVSYNYTTLGSESGCTIHSHAQRHAVRKVGSSYYCYDKNGNMTSRAGTAITWTSFNMPSAIGSGTPSSTFSYGPDRQRFKQVGNYTGGTETTYYVGGILEKLVTSTRTHYKQRIIAPTGLVAIYNRRSDSTEDTFYFTKDHLGSVDTVTDASGAVEVRLSYTAFGARRDETDWNGVPASGDLTAIADTSRRGYTEHEHLDNLGLIHMNGRVQDPVVGRFLSVDPFIQDLLQSQTLNGYSYVLNNPLSLVDPTGYLADDMEVTWTCIDNCERLGGFGATLSGAEARSLFDQGLATMPSDQQMWSMAPQGFEAGASGFGFSLSFDSSLGSEAVFGGSSGGDIGFAGSGALETNYEPVYSNGAEIYGDLGRAIDVHVDHYLKNDVKDAAIIAVTSVGPQGGLSVVLKAVERLIALKRMAGVRAMGRAGEAASEVVKNTQRITSATGTAAYRIPDGLDHAAKVISEVKNVAHLSLTSQLRDSLAYAAQRGYTLELWVRSTTQLSGPLQQLVARGEIILKELK